MKLVRGIDCLSHAPTHPVVTIGNFDGVHLGHKAIIQLAAERARARSGELVAYTFRPHPQVLLHSKGPIQLLVTYDEKVDLLSQLGVDVLIEEPFTLEFSKTEPEVFFNEVLLGKLKAEEIVVGYDFAFGRKRHGHLDALEQFCRQSNVELRVVEPQKAPSLSQDVAGQDASKPDSPESPGSQVVSSSRIRKHLLLGELEVAKKLMGRPFSYRGEVIRGDRRGHQLGFPTANLKNCDNKLALPRGVYATWTVCGGRRFKSVTNVGVRPTFIREGESSQTYWVETHLINPALGLSSDPPLDLYGQIIEVQFESHLRPEKKFSGVEELKAQILIDITQAEARLQNST
ncbi:unnamed protein product [Sphagnum tenellum]